MADKREHCGEISLEENEERKEKIHEEKNIKLIKIKVK